jgi:hypothetical protein
VLSVKPEPPIRANPAWQVRYRRTATEKGPLHDEIPQDPSGAPWSSPPDVRKHRDIASVASARRPRLLQAVGEGFSGMATR